MNWFKNFKIRTKLMIGFLVIIILLGIIGFMGFNGTRRNFLNVESALTNELPGIENLVQANCDLYRLLAAERSMIFADVQSATFKQLEIEYQESLRQAKDRISKYEALIQDPQEKILLSEYKKAWSKWEALSQQIVKGRKDDTPEGRRLSIDLSLGQARQAFIEMIDYLAELRQLRNEMASELESKSDSVYQTTFISILSLTGLSILIALIILFILHRTITRPILKMVAKGHELEVGTADLTRQIGFKSKDEIGELGTVFDNFIARIRDIIVKVKENTHEILNFTENIANGSQELATRTNQQAASITETSTTLEEFTSIMKQSSEQAQEANSQITSFDREVHGKRELIINVTDTMTEIDSSSKKIGNIMSVINDISFQTNLLALNAAVEAARAGEAGRGFAVVASEVRNLAQKTADSSKTIQEIVSTNVDSTHRGMELVHETEKFFESIMKVLSQLSQLIQGIESGSHEQFTGMEQISQAVLQLDKVISQNADLVNNFAKIGSQMRTNASQLKELVGQFQTDTAQDPRSLKSNKQDTGKTTIKKDSRVQASTSKKESKKEKPTAETKSKTSSPASAPAPSPQKSKEPQSAEDFFSSDEDGFEEF